MHTADEYKRRAEENDHRADDPKLSAHEREAFKRIASEWRTLETEARKRFEYWR
jgi:hypothetical protein